MINANGNLACALRTRSAAAEPCLQPMWLSATAPLAGGSRFGRSVQAHDPGGGPGI